MTILDKVMMMKIKIMVRENDEEGRERKIDEGGFKGVYIGLQTLAFQPPG